MKRGDLLTRIASFVVVALSAAALVEQAAWFDRTSSVTYDESFYARRANDSIALGHLDPTLANYGAAPLPVLLLYLPAVWREGTFDTMDPSRKGPADWRVVSAARASNAWVSGVGLVVLVAAWTARRKGAAAAALAAALMAFSPSVLAHASLATADGLFALSAVAALAALVWFRALPSSVLRFAVLVGTIGIAIAAKYSGIFLFVVTGLVFAVDATRSAGWNEGRRLKLAAHVAGAFACVVAAAIVVAWGLHGFAILDSLDGLAWPVSMTRHGWILALSSRSLPSPFTGFIAQILHNEKGHKAFFLGERSIDGWWSYYPVTLVLKSSPAEMVLALGMLGSLVVAPFRRSGRRRMDATREVWLVAGLVYLGFLVTSRIDIGHRYTLPLYPLLTMAAVDAWWDSLAAHRVLRTFVAAGLVVAQMGTALWVGPDKLSYFSPFFGGPREGYRYLADSNVDWGQDLLRLRSGFERLGYRHPILAYFGKEAPGDYGIHATPWYQVKRGDLGRYDVLAISATTLQAVYDPGDDCRAPLRDLAPSARAGNSILLYDLRDPGVFEVLERCAGR